MRQMQGGLREPIQGGDQDPVELRVRDVTHEGRPTLGGYEILVRHPHIRGLPDTDECVSIEQRNFCPSTAAHNSAPLLEVGTDATRFER